jgi:hypothetical protein
MLSVTVWPSTAGHETIAEALAVADCDVEDVICPILDGTDIELVIV